MLVRDSNAITGRCGWVGVITCLFRIIRAGRVGIWTTGFANWGGTGLT